MWFAVYDQACEALEWRELRPGANLLEVMLWVRSEEREPYGWKFEEWSPICADIYCTKDGQRQRLSIQPTDPSNRGGHISPSRAFPEWPQLAVAPGAARREPSEPKA